MRSVQNMFEFLTEKYKLLRELKTNSIVAVKIPVWTLTHTVHINQTGAAIPDTGMLQIKVLLHSSGFNIIIVT